VDKVIGQNISFNAHISGVLISPPLWTVHIYSYCHPIPSLIHIFSLQIWGIYPTVWRYFLLGSHTNTYHVLSAVLLQLFTPRNYLQLCGRKHFASAMETLYIWQSILHQPLHYNQHQHCFLSCLILPPVKILSE